MSVPYPMIKFKIHYDIIGTTYKKQYPLITTCPYLRRRSKNSPIRLYMSSFKNARLKASVFQRYYSLMVMLMLDKLYILFQSSIPLASNFIQTKA